MKKVSYKLACRQVVGNHEFSGFLHSGREAESKQYHNVPTTEEEQIEIPREKGKREKRGRKAGLAEMNADRKAYCI